MSRTARCCCGGVIVTTKGDPAINAVCYCNDCKQRTGSAFGWSVYFDYVDTDVRGDVVRYAVSTDDSEQERFFCHHCGTTVYWFSSYFADLIGIAGGCFDMGTLPEPTLTVMNDQACGWVTLPDHWRQKLGA